MSTLTPFTWVRVEECVNDTVHLEDRFTDARVIIQDKAWLVQLYDPFRHKPEDADRLDWYFEQRHKLPEAEAHRAKLAEESLVSYGAKLFAQLFSPAVCPLGQAELDEADFAFEIQGSRIQKLLWEAIRSDPSHEPFSVRTAVVRRGLTPPNQLPNAMDRPMNRSIIRVLLVLSRPYRQADIPMDIIAWPLHEVLSRPDLEQRYRMDIVRPGSFEALVTHLRKTSERNGEGFYDIIHFDVHGAMMTTDEVERATKDAAQQVRDPDIHSQRTSRRNTTLAATARGADLKPYLLFSGDRKSRRSVDPVHADTIAQLLLKHRIRKAVLNSCESSKEGTASAPSLARMLSQTSCEIVVGFSFSITAKGATVFIKAFYQRLVEGTDIGLAVSSARHALFISRIREVGLQKLEAHDWLLPVVYSTQFSSTLELDSCNSKSVMSRGADKSSPKGTSAATSHLHGRGLDILGIENTLLEENGCVLINGAAGVGKTSLLQYLAWWWKTTNFVDDCFIFDLRETPCSVDIIHSVLARRDLVANVGSEQFHADKALQILEALSQGTFAIFIDSIEKSSDLLSQEESAKLRSLLRKIAKSETYLCLATQGIQPDNVLARTFEHFVYELNGLDDTGVEMLVGKLLDELPPERKPERLEEVLKLTSRLDGNPLAIEVVLSGLATKAPNELLLDLKAASKDLLPSIGLKSDRLYVPIKAFYASMSESRKLLLLCLAPLTLHLDRMSIARLGTTLKKHPNLVNVAVDQLPQLFAQLSARGLLKPAMQHLGGRLMLLHPMLTTFLQEQLDGEDYELQEAINVCCLQNFATESEVLLLERQSMTSDEDRYQISVIIDFQFEYLFGTLRAMILEFGKPVRNITTLLCNNFFRLERMSECYNVASTVLNLYRQIKGAECSFRVDIVVAYYWACVAASGLGWQDEIEPMAKQVDDHRVQLMSNMGNEIDNPEPSAHDLKTISLVYREILLLMGSNALKSDDNNMGQLYFAKAKEVRNQMHPSDSMIDDSLLVEYSEQGKICINQGRFKEAELSLSQAINVYDKNPRFQAFDQIWSSIMLLADVKKQLGDMRNAVNLYERAFDMLPHNPSSIMKRVNVLINISTLQGLLGDNAKSAETGRSSLILLNQYKVTQPTQQIPEVAQYRGTAYHNIGMSMANRGLLVEAQGMFKDAIEQKRKGGLFASLPISYQALGSLNQNHGLFTEAATNYVDAIALAAEDSAPKDVERYVFKSLGYLMLDIKASPVTAASFLQRSLAAVLPATRLKSGDHQTTEATIQELRGDLAVARQLVAQAINLYGDPENPTEIAKCSEAHIRHARLCLLQGDYSEALKGYWKGLKTLVSIPDANDFPSAAGVQSATQLLDMDFFEQEEPNDHMQKAVTSMDLERDRYALEHRPHRLHAVSTYNLAYLVMQCKEWHISAQLFCCAVKMWNMADVFEASKPDINAWAATRSPAASEERVEKAHVSLCSRLAERIWGHLTDEQDTRNLGRVRTEIEAILTAI